jgi:hypothetical protein
MTTQIAVEMTVEQLRQLTETLPGDTTLRVGIRDDHHFNSFLGSLPVAAARIEPVPNGHTVILDVPGVS